MKKEKLISGSLRGNFWQPLISPEARKERSCQSFSASHIGPRARFTARPFSALVELICFRERIGGNCQSFAVSTLHRQLIDTSLSLFTFKWQGKSLSVNSIEFFEVVWLFVAQRCNGA